LRVQMLGLDWSNRSAGGDERGSGCVHRLFLLPFDLPACFRNPATQTTWYFRLGTTEPLLQPLALVQTGSVANTVKRRVATWVSRRTVEEVRALDFTCPLNE
jgi:hypothetical protein